MPNGFWAVLEKKWISPSSFVYSNRYPILGETDNFKFLDQIIPKMVSLI